ncbi:fibronectin type-III domain-containing protein 3A-like [Leptopilina heterotoma]|uniref:fibronectin type-III domain-containing protein 3A-like n=1 Tax=Leptopilina heterotoma TaxID=63436 RepID=UPI001CA98A5B|nr:fibronectin type-III domain-containing protein 3A-like [Leptopilina heterotoma]
MSLIFYIYAACLIVQSICTDEFDDDFFMRNIQKLGRAPGGIKVLDVTDRTINLQWKNYYNSTMYYIFVHNLRNGISKFVTKCKVQGFNNTTEFRITELSPGMTYKFEILNLQFDPFLEKSFVRQISDEITTKMLLARPSNVKEPFLAYDVTYSQLTLQWRKPENADDFVKYNIMWSETDLWTWNTIDFQSSSDYPQYKITGLKAGRRYNFQIQAYNENGSSNSHVIEELMTKHPQDIVIDGLLREPPSEELKIIDVKDTSVKLEWTKPKNSLINVDYALFILNTNTMKRWYHATVNDHSDKPVAKVNELTPGEKYKFIIKPLDVSSKALVSREMILENPLYKPNQPKGPLYIKNVTNTTVVLQWRKPDNSPNIVVYTIFTVNPNDIWTNTEIHNASSDQVRYEVTKLKPGNVYKFYIFATKDNINSQGLKSVKVRTINP